MSKKISLSSARPDEPDKNKKINLSKEEYLNLYEWLKTHPDPEIKEIIKLAELDEPLPKLKPSLWERVTFFFCANPQEFYGKSYVTEEVKTGAKITAGAVSVSNLTDVFSNAPLIWLAFKGLGFFPALFLSSIINYGILKFGNYTAASVSRGYEKNRSWSRMALVGLVSLNVLQTLASGIGIELLNNQSGLKQILAAQLIQEQLEKVETLKVKDIDSPDYRRYDRECEEGRKQSAQIPVNDSRRDNIIVRIDGLYQERKQNWAEVPFNNLPVCQKVARLEQQKQQPYEQAKGELDKKLVLRTQMGNDFKFLKQEYPILYEREFTEDGQILSEVKEVELAIDNFFGKIKKGEWANLGFSLYFFAFSALTSIASVLMTIKFARRNDVAKSFDPKLAIERDQWLHQLLQQAIEAQRADRSELDDRIGKNDPEQN
jgi:hypothetical protein